MRTFETYAEAQRIYVGPIGGQYQPPKHASGIPLAYQPLTHDKFVVVKRVKGFEVWNRDMRCTVFTHASEKACQNKAEKLNGR
jgi:hypothetical protein